MHYHLQISKVGRRLVRFLYFYYIFPAFLIIFTKFLYMNI